MTKLRLLLAAGLVSPALALSACGGGDDGTQAATRPNGYNACVIADVSGSTRRARTQYVNAFRTFATDAGEHGSGSLCLVLAAGDPQAEGTPMTTSVAPIHRS